MVQAGWCLAAESKCKQNFGHCKCIDKIGQLKYGYHLTLLKVTSRGTAFAVK